jgi:putative transposase
MALFRNKYRIKSSRWPGWDYSAGGLYFITICTNPRYPFFGRINNRKMILSDGGIIVDRCWCSIPEHYKTIELGVFSVMPDHFHGIIQILVANRRNRPGDCNSLGGRNVETGHAPSLRAPTPFISPDLSNANGHCNDQPQPPACAGNRPSLGNVVGSFKSAVTNQIRASGTQDFGWQERYYDRVIRDDAELFRIERYIRENPEKW